MNEKSLLIVFLFLGLFAINNAVFKGLDTENRIMLGFLGVGSLAIGIVGLFVV
jgi:hypothetical protein